MERQHYLDQLRAFLMFVGIPYHSGLVYSTNIDWTVSSEETAAILTWASQFTHTFRMPAFMLISGFFALVMIRKQGETSWLKNRFLRLGVPLVSVALLVNPFQMLAEVIAIYGVPGAWEAWMSRLSSPGGHWVQQLWFLSDLLIYSLLLAFAWRHGEKLRLDYLCRGLLDRIGRSMTSIVVTLNLVGIGTAIAAAAGSMLDINCPLSCTFQTTRTITFASFFFLGAALAYRPHWLEKFITIHWPCWLAAATGCVLLTVVEPRDEPMYKLMSYFLTPIAGVLSAHVLLSGARKWFNRSTATTAKMVEVSMTVYLFHSLFICWAGVALLEASWHPLIEFSLIVALSTITSLCVHALVRRSGTLLFLFNGVTRNQKGSMSKHGRSGVVCGVDSG
jgi:glucan biosynthesis protein C